MFLDLINLERIRRAILYALIMFVSLILQNMVLSHVSPLGVRAMFMPVFAVAVGMFEGGVWGGVFGLISGIICDMYFPENTVLFMLLFSSAGFFSGMFSHFSINKRFFSFFFICVAALALVAFCQMFKLWIVHGSEISVLARVAGLQMLWSLPFTPLIYFPCRSLHEKQL